MYFYLFYIDSNKQEAEAEVVAAVDDVAEVLVTRVDPKQSMFFLLSLLYMYASDIIVHVPAGFGIAMEWSVCLFDLDLCF